MIDTKSEVKKLRGDPIGFAERFLYVTTKPDNQGNSRLVPLKFNRAQRYFAENYQHSNIVVKAQQIGQTTVTSALDFHALMMRPHTRAVISSYSDDRVQMLFEIAERFYQNLPDKPDPITGFVRPEKGRDSLHYMSFPDRGSVYHAATASQRVFLKGEPIHRLHLSEVALYEPNHMREIIQGVSGAVPKTGYQTWESTPKGRGGAFYEKYQGAKLGENEFKHFFFPWFWDEGYFLDPTVELDKQYILAKDLEHFQLTEEEEELTAKYGLTTNQLLFRRWKIRLLGEDFKQQFPENDEECFLSVGGNVFPAEPVERLLIYANNPIYTEDSGKLKVWKHPRADMTYVVTCDVGSGMMTGDASAATVLSKDIEHVASLHGNWPPDIFARKAMQLSDLYNRSLLSAERNPVVGSHGETFLATVLNSGFPQERLYRWKDGKYGWLTTNANRDKMIDDMRAMLNSGDFKTQDRELLMQMKAMYYREHPQHPGTYKALVPKGKHDDLIFAIMQGIQILPSARRGSYGKRKILRFAPVFTR